MGRVLSKNNPLRFQKVALRCIEWLWEARATNAHLRKELHSYKFQLEICQQELDLARIKLMVVECDSIVLVAQPATAINNPGGI